MAGGSASTVCLPGSFDAGIPGGDLLADGGFTSSGSLLADAGVVATATSTYSGYPAESVLDFDVDTSWYINSTCAGAGPYCCEAESIRLDLPTARTINGVLLLGNQGSFSTSYDFLTARLELLSASGSVLATEQVVFNRPDGDWARRFAPAIQNVRAVRLVPGWAESTASGIAEIRLYVP